MFLQRMISRAVRTYLRHTPVQRGTHLLKRTTAPWLVAQLDTGPWIRVSGVSNFEWGVFRGNRSPEWRTMERFSELITAGATVLDVGANIGYYTLTAASRIGASGRVLSLEPNPHAAARLRENIALNRLTNATVIEAAASRNPGTLTFHLGDDSEASSLFDPGPEAVGAVKVRVSTIDDELKAAGIDRVEVLKMDVEGAEIEALHGAERLLTGSRPPKLFLEANPIMLRSAGTSVDEMRRCVEGFGYRISVIEAVRWRGEETENWLAVSTRV